MNSTYDAVHVPLSYKNSESATFPAGSREPLQHPPGGGVNSGQPTTDGARLIRTHVAHVSKPLASTGIAQQLPLQQRRRFRTSLVLRPTARRRAAVRRSRVWRQGRRPHQRWPAIKKRSIAPRRLRLRREPDLPVWRFTMKPHATLFLDITASLRASTNGSDWLPQYAGVAARSAKGIYCSTTGHLIGGIAAHNSKIVGEGVLDAQCQQYIIGVGGHVDNGQDGGGPDELSYRTLAVPGHGNIRVGVLALSNSINVTIGGIQLANSHAWTSAYYNCSNLLISGVRIYGDWRMPNNDGIDICSCTNTTIEDVDVDTGDDCISPKSNVGEILPGGKPQVSARPNCAQRAAAFTQLRCQVRRNPW